MHRGYRPEFVVELGVPSRHVLALALMDIGAVLTSASDHPLVVERDGKRGFKLKLHEKNPDAPLSPVFLNLRTPDNPKPGPLTPDIVDLAARCMCDLVMMRGRHVTFDAVVGVPRAGDPFAAALARLIDIPRIEMDKWEHEGQRRIARVKGRISGSIRDVLLVDDLITKADSKVEAIQNLREDSFGVHDVVVLVDREQGGRRELGELGCDLHAVFTITELLDLYVDAGRMTPGLRTDIQIYLAQAT